MTESRSFGTSFRGAPFTAGFMAVCVLLFMAGLIDPGMHRLIFIRLCQVNAVVAEGEWWRIFTSAFLHGGPAHILFNMWALLQFGPPLERELGTSSFAALCMACAAWGGAAVYVLTSASGAVVGASGALFGVFGVWLYASYFARETPLGQARFRSLMNMLVLNLLVGFTVPRISWQGHAGGLAAGIAIAAAWRMLPAPSTSAQRTLVGIVAALLAVAVVILWPVPSVELAPFAHHLLDFFRGV